MKQVVLKEFFGFRPADTSWRHKTEIANVPNVGIRWIWERLVNPKLISSVHRSSENRMAFCPLYSANKQLNMRLSTFEVLKASDCTVGRCVIKGRDRTFCRVRSGTAFQFWWSILSIWFGGPLRLQVYRDAPLCSIIFLATLYQSISLSFYSFAAELISRQLLKSIPTCSNGCFVRICVWKK